MSTDWASAPLQDLDVTFGTRPEGPRFPDLSPQDRETGRTLGRIHAVHLRDMARISLVIDRIEAGDSPPEHLAQVVLAAEMSRNFQAFGTLCGQECQMLSFHHNAEEYHMFPELEAKATDAVRAVVARLRAEHEVVHELLDRLGKASDRLMRAPSEAEFAQTRAIFAQLYKVVQSHFGYEEAELEDAISRYLDQL